MHAQTDISTLKTFDCNILICACLNLMSADYIIQFLLCHNKHLPVTSSMAHWPCHKNDCWLSEPQKWNYYILIHICAKSHTGSLIVQSYVCNILCWPISTINWPVYHCDWPLALAHVRKGIIISLSTSVQSFVTLGKFAQSFTLPCSILTTVHFDPTISLQMTNGFGAL